MSPLDLSILFFLQLAVILAACRAVGSLARALGQPQVVGEMIAGVVLGPSVFGLLAPGWQAALFPAPSLTILFAVSQVGLALYMFLVGMEFRTELLRSRLRGAIAVSLAGMFAPFLLGAGLGWWLSGETGQFFTARTHAGEAALFLGAALCITAFPMLARIIHERGLSGTALGTLALAAGALDDAAAWCLLAVVLSSFSGDWLVAARAIGGGALYAVATLTLVPRLFPLLERFATATPAGGASDDAPVPSAVLGTVLCAVMVAAWITDALGIYAVFGAFLLGAACPDTALAGRIRRTLEPLVVTLLLPLFFTYSGLRTRLDLVDTAWLWLVALAVLAAAVLGKGVACFAAARASGEDHRTALAIGALMNARGLMELIIINIGLERGIITPQLFSILVIMAIATTLMATPIFERVIRLPRPAGSPLPAQSSA